MNLGPDREVVGVFDVEGKRAEVEVALFHLCVMAGHALRGDKRLHGRWRLGEGQRGGEQQYDAKFRSYDPAILSLE